MRVTPNGRDQMIKDLREKGHTLQYIGDVFGITRERVRQILEKLESSTDTKLDKKRVGV